MSTVFQKRRKRLANAVLADAKRFDMRRWFSVQESKLEGPEEVALCNPPTKEKFEQCGTSACLAGTALLVFPRLRTRVIKDVEKYPVGYSPQRTIAAYLGVDASAFHTGQWPVNRQNEYIDMPFKGRVMKKARLAIQVMNELAVE